MRAVVYARYSTNLQNAASIEDQLRTCTTRIEREPGWQLVQVYQDAALSGASPLRPGYQKLLQDACAQKFDVVVAEALDRLSRDQEDVAALYKHLAFADVRIITLAEGEVNEMHVGLKGTMNALFLKDLAQKTRRGLEGRVRQGRAVGKRVYGYEIVREIDPATGERVRGRRRINPQEAAIVRRIFEAFAAGQAPAKIAKALNAEGISGPNGRPWQGNTLTGHSRRRNGILRNELYIGRQVWNRQHFVKDPRTCRRVPRLNPEADWVVQAVPALRIIADALWSAVAARLENIEQSPRTQKIRASRFWEKRRPGHLLTGVVRCGACGGIVTAVGGDYLACAAARKMGTCDNKRGLPRPALERFVLETLQDHLMHPDLVKAFVAEFHAEVNRHRREQDLLVERKQRDLVGVTRKLDGLIEAIAEGLRSPGLQQKLHALERRKAELERQLADAPVPLPRLHPNLAELYRRKVADLEMALRDPALHDEALAILRGLIERVDLIPTTDGFDVEVVGAIAHMVQLPTGIRKNDDEPLRVSVKRVSGA